MEYYIIAFLVITNLIVFSFLMYEKFGWFKKNKSLINEKELNDILFNLHQAILLFNNEEELLFYNREAINVSSLINSDLGRKAEDIFITNKEIVEAIKSRKEQQLFDVTLGRKIYLVNIYSVYKKNSNSKSEEVIIVAMKDVTETRNVEQTKRDFFAHASHELKSPLTAILGYSELMNLNMVEEKDFKNIVERIFKQAKHMSLLVEDMQTLSMLETIAVDDRYEIVNLSKTLKETIDSLEPFVREKRIKLKVSSSAISLKSNSLDINKLFKNLIENAIKYSKSDSDIDILLFKNKNKQIVFTVKDYGIGIEEIHQKRIFERFYRVDKGRKDLGTGLGLAIVKHIVIKYEGTIEIKSKINEGTEVTVIINESK
ncbi:MAG: ATP-binding protein [Acholeplasma sp.]|nr:ATP-binding protein [Acholeplasma sp.]